jgi:hypothetical protein
LSSKSSTLVLQIPNINTAIKEFNSFISDFKHLLVKIVGYSFVVKQTSISGFAPIAFVHYRFRTISFVMNWFLVKSHLTIQKTLYYFVHNSLSA